ncbi:Endoplasmic reticulum-Golgi intermediate compartment protein 3, partial [Linum perenne]
PNFSTKIKTGKLHCQSERSKEQRQAQRRKTVRRLRILSPGSPRERQTKAERELQFFWLASLLPEDKGTYFHAASSNRLVSMDAVVQKLRNLDAYPKINEDFYSRTLSGGVITLVSAIVMFFLFISEFSLYLHTVTETKLLVDTARGETLRINFDVTFPAIPCSLLSLDAMDISGEKHFDIRHDITKKRINAQGHVIEAKQSGIGAPTIEKPLQKHGGRLEHGETYCGSCFGAETSDDQCCNSCEEVQEAYKKKGWALTNADMIDQCQREGFIQQVNEEVGEGCNIHGSLEVNKVAGNFHFIPGKSFHQSNMFLHDLLAIEKDNYNVSHRINSLAFGDYFPGVVNPLDGVQWMHDSPNGMHQYFIKVCICNESSYWKTFITEETRVIFHSHYHHDCNC